MSWTIPYLHCDLEGHLSDGAEGGVESSLCQVLLCHHVSYGLRHKDTNISDKNRRGENHSPVRNGKLWHLCCGQENIIRYVAHATGDNAQSHSGEDVGVVSLAGVEGTAVRQYHLIKWTSTGKNAPALVAEEDTDVCARSTRETNSCRIIGLRGFTSVRV